ncbi:hypothetical protein A3A76_05840 [Candidatus Woesebacteria bacterium RIFCSPLOWO2_01_FULL_39_23]|uniref:Uncharacterized protein n=1 Tax=Candidatus Woesebacteria bacterium RIFCSPHIGHO2_01_FULL_40_22 TaxID=1802499 RepID=A0A1F7YI27_9BACT|nr:MAG: hypothetical protein A2141_02535 [Candidatus Woesebacteria bacterium RBG_16_40_11]OGM26922.1 MAG: hypothetical protein A2628_05780 [Candidatus Woesebacteria bacterium RIFCSPHIGHO2_01_FULL_40_22]OGM37332.1 MAG: hypothetical protein A3E41_04180 [Candidatus Woesebacteria bacterium RIFCSPHIGHO2_12_FULL_38_9]OGM63197.1 MAG: hypothetical protein A3A76_05840 [Candidatus Woesebacteria bacterium RIFCSPLOWO2_01_FULL_39_23]
MTKESRKGIPRHRRKYSDIGDQKSFGILNSWLTDLDLVLSDEERKTPVGEKLLISLSIIAGYRHEPVDSPVYMEAQILKEKVEASNAGEFNPKVLYKLLKQEESNNL